jgi:probable dihydroxyacetone kinase regulator
MRSGEAVSDSNVTKNALAASMKKLMLQRPFEKISVSDICGDCGVNRKSFYYHFRDKYDLVNWIFYVGFVEGMNLASYESGWDCLADTLRFFYADKAFYQAALRIEGQNSFKDYLKEIMTPVSEFFMRDIVPSAKDDEFYLTFILDSFLASLVRWLSGEYKKPMDADEYLEKIKKVIQRLASQL